jgi:hypothetical protein
MSGVGGDQLEMMAWGADNIFMRKRMSVSHAFVIMRDQS